jgi:hypothetical protein
MTTQQRLEQTLSALRQMTVNELRDKHQELFGEPTSAANKDFLRKRLIWRIQSLTEGTLSERAQRRAAELARDADLRTTVPRPRRERPDAPGRTTVHVATKVTSHDRLPIPGTILSRTYKGRLIETQVLPEGFEYEGQVYRSLSAVARAVTGSHWNGPLFFGLTGSAKETP